MKFIVTGIEKVRDVVEADDFEAAERVFRAKYPAVYKVLDVEEIPDNPKLYPEYVRIEGNGTALMRSPGFWAQQDKNRKFCTSYWRDAGEWGCATQIIDGQLCVNSPDIPGIHGKKLIECTREEWAEDNEGYLE